MFLGLRTVVYPTADLEASKAWFSGLLGQPPYFDQPFYVGFEVGGYELGLLPQDAEAVVTGPVTYWGVPDADRAMEALLAAGATAHEPVTEVGEGIRTASVREPRGSLIGIIENPHFALPDQTSLVEGGLPPAEGPGR